MLPCQLDEIQFLYLILVFFNLFIYFFHFSFSCTHQPCLKLNLSLLKYFIWHLLYFIILFQIYLKYPPPKKIVNDNTHYIDFEFIHVCICFVAPSEAYKPQYLSLNAPVREIEVDWKRIIWLKLCWPAVNAAAPSSAFALEHETGDRYLKRRIIKFLFQRIYFSLSSDSKVN